MKPPDTARIAWQRFVEAFEPLRPELYRYCRFLTRNAWDAEDLVQDALARGRGGRTDIGKGEGARWWNDLSVQRPYVTISCGGGAVATSSPARDDRIELRASREEKRVLAAAAAYERLDLTSFVMRSALPCSAGGTPLVPGFGKILRVAWCGLVVILGHRWRQHRAGNIGRVVLPV
jgi:hypothetical protein